MAWNEPGGDKNGEKPNRPKDPWGNNGNKNNQQPPDLDQILSDFFDKIGGLFGGKKPSGGSSNTPKPSKGGLGLIALLALVAYGVWGFTTIVDGEQGVLTQFGKYKTTVQPGPTFVFKPFQQLTVVNVQNVKTISNKIDSQGQREMLTKDENIAIVEYDVQFSIKDAKDFLFNDTSPVATLKKSSESVVRAIVGKNDLEYIRSSGRNAIVVKAKEDIQTLMDSYQTGIQVRNFNMQKAQFPKEVKSAVDDVTKAREDKERFINQAEAYRNQIVPEARGQSVKMIEEAKGYHVQVVKQAEGEAQRFSQLLKEYKKAPQVTRERLYLDSVERVLSNSGKVVIDTKGGNNMMYLPLDKISGGASPSSDVRQRIEQVMPSAVQSSRQSQQIDTQTEDSLESRLRSRTRELR